MEKYNSIKTIGDGTYGSVVKALNMKSGNNTKDLIRYRWDCCSKENEEKVFQMGELRVFKRDSVADEAVSS